MTARSAAKAAKKLLKDSSKLHESPAITVARLVGYLHKALSASFGYYAVVVQQQVKTLNVELAGLPPADFAVVDSRIHFMFLIGHQAAAELQAYVERSVAALTASAHALRDSKARVTRSTPLREALVFADAFIKHLEVYTLASSTLLYINEALEAECKAIIVAYRPFVIPPVVREKSSVAIEKVDDEES